VLSVKHEPNFIRKTDKMCLPIIPIREFNGYYKETDVLITLAVKNLTDTANFKLYVSPALILKRSESCLSGAFMFL
jgi:hypothetical protein